MVCRNCKCGHNKQNENRQKTTKKIYQSNKTYHQTQSKEKDINTSKYIVKQCKKIQSTKPNLIQLRQKQQDYNYLQGNVHILWLFVTIKPILPEQFKKIIKNVYLSTKTNQKQIQNIIQNSKYLGFQKHLQQINEKNKILTNKQTVQYIIPLINNPQHIRQFMNILKMKKKINHNQQYFVFRILTDSQSFQSVTNIVADLRKQNQKIDQIHVYWKDNSQYQNITSKYEKIKKTIKNSLSNNQQIKTIIKSFCQDKIDIQKQIRAQSPLLLKLYVNPFTKQIIISKKSSYYKLLPEFIIIDQQYDKSEYTLLRQTIQLSKILSIQNLRKYKQKTVKIAKQIYEYYKIDIQSYQSLQQSKVNKIDFYKQILYTYTKPSFYYKFLNNSLRKSTNYNDLQHCIKPINQMYHSISQMCKKYIIKNNYKIQKDIILYKGCKIIKSEYQNLKKGQFIQFYGFLSTSLLKNIAEKFVIDNDQFRVILQIKIPKRTFTAQQLQNFIGFVDFQNFKQQIQLKSQFPSQQQVILNVLTVLKIIDITKLNKQSINKDEIHYIKTQIFDLQNYCKDVKKNKISLLDNLKNIPIISHKYNVSISQQKIQDIGDMFMFTNNIEKAQQFYKQQANHQKINNNLKKFSSLFIKIRKVEEAEKLLKQAQQIYKNSDQLQQIERKLKIRIINNYYVQIQKQTLNFPRLQKRYTEHLQELLKNDPNNYLQITKIIYGLANLKLKKGEIQQVENFFFNTQKKFKIQKNHNSIYRPFSFIKSLFTKKSKQKVGKANNKQQMTNNLQQNFKQFKKLQIKINISLLEAKQKIFFFTQNHKQQYKNCINETLNQITNFSDYQNKYPIQKAQIDAMKARVQKFQNKIKAEAKFITLIQNLQQDHDKNHKNIVFYSQQLAQIQNKILNEIRNQPNNQNIFYDKQKVQKYYNACKNNLLKARQILQNRQNPGHEQNIRQIDNQISKLDIQSQKFKQGQQRIQNIKQQYLKSNNKTQFKDYNLSKTLFLDATLNFEKGYNKKAFQYIQLSEKHLTFAMVGRHNRQNDQNKAKQYNVFLYHSQLYLKIKFLLSKIYHRQTAHDLALKEINNLIVIMKTHYKFYKAHYLMPQFLQMKGQYLLYTRNIKNQKQQFDIYFQKAIDLRKKQHGKDNFNVARNYYNYAKNLAKIFQKNFDGILKIVQKGNKIMGKHPNWPQNWIGKFVTAFVLQRKIICEYQIMKQNDKKLLISTCLQMYKQAKQFVDNYYDISHSARRQVRIGYAYFKNKYSSSLQNAWIQYQQILNIIKINDFNELDKSNKSNTTVSTQGSQNLIQSLIQINKEQCYQNQNQFHISPTLIASKNNQLKQIHLNQQSLDVQIDETDNSRIVILNLIIKQLKQFYNQNKKITYIILKNQQQSLQIQNHQQNLIQFQILSHYLQNINQIKCLFQEVKTLRLQILKRNQNL